jgi:hypothetical protein
MSDHLTRDEVAALARTNSRNITRWFKTGRFPKPILVGSKPLWPREQIEAVLRGAWTPGSDQPQAEAACA